MNDSYFRKLTLTSDARARPKKRGNSEGHRHATRGKLWVKMRLNEENNISSRLFCFSLGGH